MIEVPAAFRAFGRWQREGAAGERWLAALPGLVADACARWDLRPDGAVRHGDNGIVVPVRRGGEPLALKVTWADDVVAEEVRALRLWDGRGTVRLVDADAAAGLLLLERLDATRTLRDLPLAEAVPLIGTVLRRLAVPAPTGVRTTGEYAAELAATFGERSAALGDPVPARLLDAATGLARDLAAGTAGTAGTAGSAGSAPAVLVDRDLHYGQVLRGRREPWLVVDPLPLAGDLEHQCGQLLWTRADELLTPAALRGALDTLVAAADLDAARARAWAVVRSVDYWLWGLDAGFTEDPVRCRRIAESFA